MHAFNASGSFFEGPSFASTRLVAAISYCNALALCVSSSTLIVEISAGRTSAVSVSLDRDRVKSCSIVEGWEQFKAGLPVPSLHHVHAPEPPKLVISALRRGYRIRHITRYSQHLTRGFVRLQCVAHPALVVPHDHHRKLVVAERDNVFPLQCHAQ